MPSSTVAIVESPVATAADYAEALIVARRAKTTLIVIAALAVLAELAAFFVARYSTALNTDPAALTAPAGGRPPPIILVHWLLTLGTFVGWVAAMLLAFVLLLVLAILLVGRLIGVARVTGALIWSVVLAAILFPWQGLLLIAPFPGVLYTWTDLTQPQTGAHFAVTPIFPDAVLHWARFVGWPIIALLILLVIHLKSRRGIRQAMVADLTPTMGADAPVV